MRRHLLRVTPALTFMGAATTATPSQTDAGNPSTRGLTDGHLAPAAQVKPKPQAPKSPRKTLRAAP